MATVPARHHPAALHPLHAILLAFPLPLFLGALLSDLAYARTFHVQWTHFSSWLIAGGLLVGAFALVWALVGVFDASAGKGRRVLYFVTLLAMWVLGLVNAFVHAKDAWGAMPEGLVLSAITSALALIAAWIGYSGLRAAEVA